MPDILVGGMTTSIGDAINWELSAKHAREAIGRVLDGPMTPHSLVNLNIPILDDGAEPLGMKTAPISTSSMVDKYEITPSKDGSFHYRSCNAMTFSEREPAPFGVGFFVVRIGLPP